MGKDEFWISTNTPSSKNGKRWTGKILIHSKATMKWYKETKEEWKNQREAFINAIQGLSFPLYIEFTFIRESRHKFDYNNMSQVVQDAMKLYGWIPDDNADLLKPYFGDYIYNKDNPGVIIKILREKPIHEPNKENKHDTQK